MGKIKTHADQAWDSSLGSKATVENFAPPPEAKEYFNRLQEVLADMGKDIQRVVPASQGMTYMGSFSMHVYMAESLHGTFLFVPVSNPHKCFFKLAEAAGMKMKGDIEQMFTGRFQKKRSGFAG